MEEEVILEEKREHQDRMEFCWSVRASEFKKARWSGKRVENNGEVGFYGNKRLPSSLSHSYSPPLSLCHFARSLNAKEEWSLLFRFQGTERPTCFRDPVFKEHERHRPLGHDPVSYFFSQEAWEGQHPLHRRTQQPPSSTQTLPFSA